VGRLAVDSKQYTAWIGKWSFTFASPILISMATPSPEAGEDGAYEFAPTSACDVSEIDALDKRLRWFRYDSKTKVVLPLAELPK
jgi:hypothetical protein